MLAAMQQRTHYRPTPDSALMRWIVRHAAWLIPRFRGSDVQSPFHRAMGGPYRGKLVEFGETVLAHLPEVGKGSGNPPPKLADRWKSPNERWSCVCAKCTTTRREQLVRRESQVNHRDKPRSTTTDDATDPRAIPELHEHENQDEEANENDGEDEESPDKPDGEDHDMEGETFQEPDTTATSSSSRREKRTETQENVFVKRRLMTKSPKRPITRVPPPEDPVKRRLMKKTDLRNDE